MKEDKSDLNHGIAPIKGRTKNDYTAQYIDKHVFKSEPRKMGKPKSDKLHISVATHIEKERKDQ